MGVISDLLEKKGPLVPPDESPTNRIADLIAGDEERIGRRFGFTTPTIDAPRAARVLKVSETLKVPVSFSEKHLEELEVDIEKDSLDSIRIRNNYPSFHSWL